MDATVTVTGKHFEITEPINAYASEKLAKAIRYYDRVSAVEILIEKPDSHSYAVEAICHVNGHDHLIAHGTHDDLYACIDDTGSKLERQIHDLKEKRRDPRGAGR